MIVVNYTQFRKEMKKYLDMVTDDYETITVTRKGDNDVVVVPADAYNNMVENLHLTSSNENFDWLMESKEQLERGAVSAHELAGDGDE